MRVSAGRQGQARTAECAALPDPARQICLQLADVLQCYDLIMAPSAGAMPWTPEPPRREARLGLREAMASPSDYPPAPSPWLV